jgi:hypothetical protein
MSGNQEEGGGLLYRYKQDSSVEYSRTGIFDAELAAQRAVASSPEFI